MPGGDQPAQLVRQLPGQRPQGIRDLVCCPRSIDAQTLTMLIAVQ